MPMFNYNNIDNIQICMDVPFVDHPYLIGPRGRKCQHLMDRHRSLIHFPDSNRRQNGPKLNNVIINGSSKNAEELRFQIRSRTPIRLALTLQNFPDANVLCSQMECAIAERSLPIRLNYTENHSNAMLKTEWRNEDTLVAFCNEFFNFDNDGGKSEESELFTMALTILPVVNPWNQELSHHLIEHIFHVTGARVFYPPKEKFDDQPPSYFIKGGTASGVLKAGKYMMGLTMFQVSFIVPSSVQMNLNNTEEWQKELLVHTTIEPVFANNNNKGDGNSEFLHNRAVLRSFEFCLNSVYFVRSLLLGFKKTVQSSHYAFMTDVKRMIPSSVFSDGQLYFPLYAIDDESSFNFDTSGTEFFQLFYGGPYSTEKKGNDDSFKTLSTSENDSINADLTSRLKSLLNISENTDSMLDKTGISDISENKSIEEVELARNNSSNMEHKLSASFNEKSSEPVLLSESPPLPPPTTTAISFVPFHQTTPTRGEPPSVVFSNCCIPATSPETVDHEDDPELQAILRRTMPCLQVTQQQVSYPANVAATEFERQFKEFVKMRNTYLQIRRSKMGQTNEISDDEVVISPASTKSRLRRSSL